MLSLADNCDKETLCSLCNTRGIYCDSTSFGRCDCCDCMPSLCISSDHAKGVSPIQYKELRLDDLLTMANQPIEREVVNV